MNKIYKTCRLAVAFGVLVAVAGCAGSGSSAIGPQVNLPAPTGQYQALAFNLTTDKSVYAVGEPVTATFTVTNTGTAAVAYQYVSPPAVSILVQAGAAEVWTASLHTNSTGGAIGPPTTLAPGASLTYPFVWSQVSDDGQVSVPGALLPQVPRGAYTIRGYSLDSFYGETRQTVAWYQTNFAAPLVTVTIQ